MGFLLDVKVFPWCMGVLWCTGVIFGGTGSHSFCVIHQPQNSGVQRGFSLLNYLFFLNVFNLHFALNSSVKMWDIEQ